MNKIQVDIDFKEGTLIPNGIDLITGDYNSTEIEFTFDEEHQNGRKVFEMKSPSNEIVMAEEIIDNKVLLASKKDITTIHNEKTYNQYTKNNETYWYNNEDNELYDNEWNQVVTFDINEYAKVQENASLFSESGYYIFEISYYFGDAKLTSVYGKLPVNEEQVVIDGKVVEPYLPIFDQIVVDISSINSDISNIQEEQGTQNSNIEANANSITNLQNNKQDTLVSGTNIKTINNESLLGSGNLEVITDLSDYYTKEEVNTIKTTIEGEIPTKTSQLDNDSDFITKEVNNLTNYTTTSNMNTAINNAVGTETTNRQNADLNLQNQIDAITSASDVVDVVSTYQDLLDYDTSKLTDKDVIKVMQDSTHSNALSYYRWLNSEWNYIGSEGPFYTKGETDTLLNAKQNVINNDNKLSADLVDDTNSTNKFTNATEKSTWNAKVGTTDYATSNTGGVVKINSAYGLQMASGTLIGATRNYTQYGTDDNTIVIDKGTLENVISNKLYTQTQIDTSQNAQDTLIQELQNENDYLQSVINQLPKVSSQGTILTLNNTINGRMNIELGTSELEQETTTGKNILSNSLASPNPQYPQTIHTISGNNKVVVCNKNLMSLGTQQNGYVDAGTLLFQDGSGGIGTAATNSVGYYFKTSQLPNTITISDVGGNRMNVCYFDEIPAYNVSCLLRSASNDNPRTITVDKTYKYVHIQFSYNDTNVSNIQVENGSTKTDYVLPTIQEANINLGDIEYCEIGDYKDKFVRDNEGNWGIRKNIGKVVLNGSEMWGNSGAANTFYSTSIIDYAISNNIPISNYYSGISNVGGSGGMVDQPNNTIAFINIDGQTTPRFYVKDTRYENTQYNDFKTWLSTHNLIVYYGLSTPTYTPITGTLAEQLENIYQYLLSYKGQTNISQVSNDLPFNISASALLDLNTLVGE